MRHTHIMAVVTLGIAIWVFGLPLNAQAKPKAKVFGCTTEDLNTNFGSSCVSQAEQDIIRGHSYIHVLVCEGGQMKCCTMSSTQQVLNCRRPAGSAALSGGLKNLNQTQVFSRGIEGEEEVGEETPVPSWLTESWLTEHEGEKPSK
ncbi:MAG: hypothetical protein KIT39_13555 [Nitrospirales bacterium]|nr:hypothetical protein [Nitrospirales bacterium]